MQYEFTEVKFKLSVHSTMASTHDHKPPLEARPILILAAPKKKNYIEAI